MTEMTISMTLDFSFQLILNKKSNLSLRTGNSFFLLNKSQCYKRILKEKLSFNGNDNYKRKPF